MPICNSQDGKWSGRDRNLVICRKLGRKVSDLERAKSLATNDMAHTNYLYCFDDGWMASIRVDLVSLKESKRCMDTSDGFYGYEWMIDSILKYGNIRL